MPRIAPVLLVCLLVVAGCGGGGDKPDRFSLTTPKTSPPEASSSAQPSATPSRSDGGHSGSRSSLGRTGPVTAREKAVVRGWSEALRHGDVDRATRYWDVPATVANGDQPYRLLTRRAVRFWNESLPCGAKLQSVERDSNYVLATFVLTERPGRGRCGSGVGRRARTLFLLRGERKIVQWLRATDPPSGDTS
jgi:hypothetical protein